MRKIVIIIVILFSLIIACTSTIIMVRESDNSVIHTSSNIDSIAYTNSTELGSRNADNKFKQDTLKVNNK